MKKERTGSLIWRLIYPLLIFLGVELIIELGATIVYFAVKMQSGAFENLSEQGIVDAATAFLTGKALYFTLIRGVVLIPLYLWIMKVDTRLDVYYERDFKYTDYRKTWLILLVPAGICAAIGFNGLVSLSGIEKFSKAYQAVEKITYSGNLFVQIMASAIAAPIVEELLFRGLIFKRLRNVTPAVWAMVISGLIFGIIHGNLVQFVYAFPIGVILAFIYEIFKTIWAPVIFHVSANFISVMLTNFLPGVEFNLTVGLLALVSVVTLAILFVILFVIDNKVKRTKI